MRGAPGERAAGDEQRVVAQVCLPPRPPGTFPAAALIPPCLSLSSSVQAGGIFSRDATQNPGFAGANQVYIGYCSSDAWMGNTEQWGFQFRGQSILAATLAQLQSNYGLGAGHQVLLAGCSAGARGVLVNLDNVAAALPGVEVRGLLDSGLWVDAQPSDPSTTESLMEETQQVYAWANAGALIPADCAAMYSGTPWYCLFGQYRIHFVQTPYFASESQFDSFLLTYNLGGETPRYGFQVTYADTLQQDVSAMMSALPAAGQSDSGVFSSTCLLHCTTNGPDYYTVKVGTQSLASAVQAWFFQDAGRQQIISGCQGWSCNSQCKGEEEPALQGGANGNGGGGLRGPPGPLHPGQYQLDPNSSEPWQEQLAQARKAAAAQAPQQQG